MNFCAFMYKLYFGKSYNSAEIVITIKLLLNS